MIDITNDNFVNNSSIKALYSDALLDLISKYPIVICEEFVSHIRFIAPLHFTAINNDFLEYRFGPRILNSIIKFLPERLLNTLVRTAVSNHNLLGTDEQSIYSICAINPKVLLVAINEALNASPHTPDDILMILLNVKAGWWDRTNNIDQMTLDVIGKLNIVLDEENTPERNISVIVQLLVFIATISLQPCRFTIPQATMEKLTVQSSDNANILRNLPFVSVVSD